jgi:hypothetical protein
MLESVALYVVPTFHPPTKEARMFKTLSQILAAGAAVVALSIPFQASAANADCEKKAVDKNGKALAGAAKTSFMKKCEGGGAAGGSSCESKAMDKNGKALAGAAKTSFLKKCEADAKMPAAASASGPKK